MMHLPSIWCQDSNSRPLDHQSPPITTRPGLLLNKFFISTLNQRDKMLELKVAQSIQK